MKSTPRCGLPFVLDPERERMEQIYLLVGFWLEVSVSLSIQLLSGLIVKHFGKAFIFGL
jgi:hypothetical protein